MIFYEFTNNSQKISTQLLTWLITCAILNITNNTYITLNIKSAI